MDRRKFLSTLIGGVVAGAAVRTFPFRVFSFPSEISYLGRLTVRVPPDYVVVWRTGAAVGPLVFEERLSFAEAKARYGYEWRPGNAQTQRAERDHRIYCAPAAGSTTGLII